MGEKRKELVDEDDEDGEVRAGMEVDLTVEISDVGGRIECLWGGQPFFCFHFNGWGGG